jgi:cell pole-organizing protein PopZ
VSEDNDYSDLISSKIDDLLKPQLKEWLNNNLSDVVDKIVREEIKKLIDKS